MSQRCFLSGNICSESLRLGCRVGPVENFNVLDKKLNLKLQTIVFRTCCCDFKFPSSQVLEYAEPELTRALISTCVPQVASWLTPPLRLRVSPAGGSDKTRLVTRPRVLLAKRVATEAETQPSLGTFPLLGPPRGDQVLEEQVLLRTLGGLTGLGGSLDRAAGLWFW